MTALLIASTGGHLTQLHRLRPRFRAFDPQDVVWVTFDTKQSRSLLSDENVVYVKYTHPRDIRSAAVNFTRAIPIIRTGKYTHAVSTGAAIAASFLPVAASQGLSTHYIESATRAQGPSVTGKLLRVIPRVNLYTQYPGLASARWSYRGSVFDGYRIISAARPVSVKKVVVSLGQIERYGFRRLIERLYKVLGSDVEVVWQTGATDTRGLPIRAVKMMPADDLRQAITDADVVVTHAGTGSALLALDCGKYPVLVPRRRDQGEHIDDHQMQIVGALGRKNLALAREADELDWEDLIYAAHQRAIVEAEPPTFKLNGEVPDNVPLMKPLSPAAEPTPPQAEKRSRNTHGG
ncbi:glycosyltransferase [Pseudofrankia sp. DC12]|uniref:glycosyltransferase n=1 Tax=Pseudofrankia sp. DC12 TaxID=683315 RepID=UPI000A059703|nr:glycosyltransferase [Pseudofrankia sp. DC12]